MVSLLDLVGGFAALVLLYSLVRYLGAAHDNLVEARERCEKAWSDVDVLLERRAEEVGSLADVAGEHVAHERSVLDDVLEARQRVVEAASPEEAAEATVALRDSVQEVYDLADEYPDLDSSDRFDELTDSIRELERRLETRRERYNDAVAAYNARLNKLPERFVARLYGFTRRQPFVASPAAREGVDVAERLSLSADDD